MGYSESLKAYRIYFPRFKKIDINRDVTFDEDSTYNKSRKKPIEDPKEPEAPRIQDKTMNDATQEERREIEKTQEPVDPPRRIILTRGKLHVYKRISKVQKDMGLQNKCTEKGKELGPTSVM